MEKQLCNKRNRTGSKHCHVHGHLRPQLSPRGPTPALQSFSNIRMHRLSCTPPPCPTRTRSRVGKKHRKIGHKPHSHGRHHPPPSPPPPTARTELKDKCKSKLACAESRESAKILQNTDAKCDTHRKTPKRKDAKCRAQHVFAQCSPPAGALFCCKTPQTPMRKQKQSSIPGEQSAKTRVSAHASRGIAPPRAAADATAANNNNNNNYYYYSYYYYYYNHYDHYHHHHHHHCHYHYEY